MGRWILSWLSEEEWKGGSQTDNISRQKLENLKEKSNNKVEEMNLQRRRLTTSLWALESELWLKTKGEPTVHPKKTMKNKKKKKSGNRKNKIPGGGSGIGWEISCGRSRKKKILEWTGGWHYGFSKDLSFDRPKRNKGGFTFSWTNRSQRIRSEQAQGRGKGASVDDFTFLCPQKDDGESRVGGK